MKRFLIGLCALLCLLSLAACGQKAAPEPEAEARSYILTNYVALPESVTGISSCALDGDRLLLCCREEADPENPAVYAAAIGTDGSGFRKLPLRLGRDEIPLALTPDRQGGLWVLCAAPQGEDSAHYALRRFNGQDRQLAEISLDGWLEEQGIRSPIRSPYPLYEEYSLETDGEGRLCVGLREVKTFCFLFDKNGNYQYSLQGEGNPKNFITTGDGRLAVCSTENYEESYALRLLDTRKRSLGEGLDLGPISKVFPGDSEGDFYLYDGSVFSRCSLENGPEETLFNWSNLGLASGDAYVCPLSEGRFAVIAGSFSQTQLLRYEFCVVEPGEDSRTVLSMLSLEPENDILEAVAQFNKSNEGYRVELDSFSTAYRSASEEDRAQALERLNMDLIAGKVPDIIDLNGLPAEAYSRRGILEDLDPWLDRDPAIDRDDYFTNVFDALRVDGRLSYVTSSLSVCTVLAAPDTAPQPGWTVDDYLAMRESGELKEKDETWMDPGWYLSNIAALDSRFVDWESGQCFYDGADFARFLEAYRALLSALLSAGDAEEENAGPFNCLCVPLSSFYDVAEFNANLGGQARDVGYPSVFGEPERLMRPVNLIGFSSACEHKEGAWAFVRSFLEPGMQESGWFFPCLKSSFEKLANQAALGNSMWAGGMFTGELSQADIALAREILSSVDRCPGTDEELLGIIQEQYIPYLSGAKTLEETAAAIQSRATMYVGERY